MITWLPHEHDKLITWLLGQYRDLDNMIPTFSICKFAIWNKLFYYKRKTITLNFSSLYFNQKKQKTKKKAKKKKTNKQTKKTF